MVNNIVSPLIYRNRNLVIIGISLSLGFIISQIIGEFSELFVIAIFILIFCLILLARDVKFALLALFLFKPIIDMTWGMRFFGNLNILRGVGFLMPLLLFFVFLNSKRLNFPFSIRKIVLLFFLSNFVVFLLYIVDGSYSILGSFNFLFRILNGITALLFIPLIFDKKEDIEKFINVWLIASLFLIGMGMYQIFTGALGYQEAGGLLRIKGVYHDIGNYKIYGTFAAAIVLFKFPFAKSGKEKLILALILALAILIIYKTYARSAWITIPVWVICLGILKKEKTLIILGLLLPVVLTLMLPEIKQRFSTETEIIEIIQEDRIGEMWKKKCAFSGRIGLWENFWNEYKNTSIFEKLLGGGSYVDVHNDFLRIILTNGLFGFIVYIYLLITIGRTLTSGAIRQIDPFYKELSFIAFLLLISIIIDSFATNPTLYTNYQWFCWGIIGIALARIPKMSKVNKDI